MTNPTILVIGGYGVFGSNVCRLLCRDGDLAVIVAGRSADKARALASDINKANPNARCQSAAFDIDGPLHDQLARLAPTIVVHAAGPFQEQDYRLAEACLELTIHYIDLADGRDFVTGFHHLDQAAKRQGATLITGASSVPGLSSAVLSELCSDGFRPMQLHLGIAPGNRAPRGLAVIEAILDYVGKPIPILRDGHKAQAYGWQDLHRREIAWLGKRWFSACDVPDVEVLPPAFPGLAEVRFFAGLELPVMHLGLWLLSWPVRTGLVRSLRPLAPTIKWMAERMERFGSDRGGMFVSVSGATRTGKPQRRTWRLVAESGDGPWIPSVPAAVLVRKLVRGEGPGPGAHTCVNLFALADFLDEARSLRLTWGRTD